MNLQYFADPEGDNGDDKGGTDGKKYTDAEVDAIVKRKKDKCKTDQEAQVEQAKKLAKMNANQKKDFELEQANERAANAKAKATRLEMGNIPTYVGNTAVDTSGLGFYEDHPYVCGEYSKVLTTPN